MLAGELYSKPVLRHKIIPFPEQLVEGLVQRKVDV